MVTKTLFDGVVSEWWYYSIVLYSNTNSSSLACESDKINTVNALDRLRRSYTVIDGSNVMY